MAEPQGRLSELVNKMRGEGVDPLGAVLHLKEEGLVSPGQEFSAAYALRMGYGLSVIQLHEVVGWLKGERVLEDLRKALCASGE